MHFWYSIKEMDHWCSWSGPHVNSVRIWSLRLLFIFWSDIARFSDVRTWWWLSPCAPVATYRCPLSLPLVTQPQLLSPASLRGEAGTRLLAPGLPMPPPDVTLATGPGPGLSLAANPDSAPRTESYFWPCLSSTLSKIVNTQFLIIFHGAASVTILSRVMGSIPFNILIRDKS